MVGKAVLFVSAFAVAAGAGVSVSPAMADAVVIGSKAPALRVGATLADDTVLDVPAGQSVTLLMSDNRTRTINGPFKQPVASFSKGKPSDDTLWQTVTQSLSKAGPKKKSAVALRDSAGGSGRPGPRAFASRPSPSPGAVATAPPSPVLGAAAPTLQPLPFSWKQIPIDAEGDVCVEKGNVLALVRPGTGPAQAATVIDVRAGARAQVMFAAGSSSTAWPASIVAKTGPYALQLPQNQPKKFRLRVIDPLPPADETLRLLHSQKCQLQIEAWLRGVATASR
jgi:hypothetical protein